ncbi:MAG: biotin--[acetyl-CoA-carboxylase] ligase [Clostridium sp.]|uniref:biotin--[acetyl-CoA-carboxylase] ligase n=1 Tax=Clostridium sp. TaxID=1506 RepID=UPI003F37C745
MKSKILKILQDSDDYISGEAISNSLNVSRNAIWKHINSLKLQGYNISSIRNKGYKLLNEPNIISKDTLLPFLETEFMARNLFSFESLESTNTYAKNLCKKEIINGACIVSKVQTSGHGRFSRVWESPLGGIWNSIVLTPNIDPVEASKITLIASASMYKTLKSFNIDTKIKWPNDIYLNDKKICGILTTMNADMDKINYLILGLGLNVNIDEEYFLKHDLNEATSLKLQFSKEFSLSQILGLFYNTFEKDYKYFLKTLDLSKTVEILKSNSMFLGKEAFLVTINNREKITIVDVSPTGELLIKDSLGNIRPVISGEITFKG